MNRILLVIVMLAGLAAVAAAPAVDWPKERKKVVAFGWEWADVCGQSPELLLKYADKIEASGIDGVSLYIYAKDADGKGFRSAQVIDGVEFTDSALSGQVEAYRKAMAHKGLRESFIRTLGAPKKRVDWKDDAHWAKVTASMAALARFAKATGVRGFIVDPEDYHNQNQFEARPDDEPYDLLAPLARRRAREIFSAVFREYPDIVVLGYWLFSWHPQHVNSENPMMSARSAGDLWPAFINGILDVIPPGAKLVDGDEWSYKSLASKNEFMISGLAQRNAVMGLVAPENRRKFRAQSYPGFGLYMDSYVNAPTNSQGKAAQYYMGPCNGSRRGMFERNLSEALDSAGEYVWLWCEKRSWIKWGDEVRKPWLDKKNMECQTWEECLPGLACTIRACADPETFLAKDCRAMIGEGKIINIATNDYVAASHFALHGKHDKKDEAHKGPGYFFVEDPTAKPGEHYVVAASGTGEGLEAIVCWQQRKGDGWWRWRIPGHGLALKKGEDGRYRAKAVVRVPEGTDCIALQLKLHPPKGQECAFDKIFVGRIAY